MGTTPRTAPAARPRRPVPPVATALAWALAAAACAGGGSPVAPPPSPPSPSSPGPPTRSSPVPRPTGTPGRIAVVVMENKEYDRVAGAPDAPFLNGLAARSVLLTRHAAVAHPSLPNYLAMVAGSTFGVTSNCTECSFSGPTVADQLSAAGVSWRAYMEGLPGPCFTGAGAGRYAKKHDPFVYFRSVTADPARCGRVVPLDRLAADLAGAGLPDFVWITPNLCHDTHDCPVEVGDAWLASWVPKVVAGLGRGGILILTYDEGSSGAGCCGGAAGGHVLTVIAGPGGASGVRISRPTDHYSILRLIEDHWGLRRLGRAACPCTPSITGWERPPDAGAMAIG